METQTSLKHMPKSHLPPSPPPSPPSTSRRRHKKRSSSLEKLANTPLPSPTLSSTDPSPTHNEESLLTRIILTPLLFTSFILSLTLINLRDRLHRTTAHAPTSLLTRLYPSTWLDPEPYQDPDDSTWARRASAAGHVEPHDALGPRGNGAKAQKRESWHLHKKIRKVAGLEVRDAFEMRERVLLGMCVGMVVGVVAVWVGVRGVYAVAVKAFWE